MKSLLFLPGFATNTHVWDLQIKEFSNFPNPDIVVGWSLGGIDAIKLYFEHPDKVKGLVLVSSFAKFLKSDDYQYGLNPVLMKNLERKLKANFQAGLEFFYDLVDNGKGLVKGQESRGKSQDEIMHELERLKQEDVRTLLLKINVPVLLIHGDRDQISPVEQSIFMKEQIPNAELKIFEGIGHAPFLEDPKRFNSILKVWLEKIWK